MEDLQELNAFLGEMIEMYRDLASRVESLECSLPSMPPQSDTSMPAVVVSRPAEVESQCRSCARSALMIFPGGVEKMYCSVMYLLLESENQPLACSLAVESPASR